MPDKKPIMLPEVVVTAKRITPAKKYREVKEKVKLYPNSEVDKYKIDSLRKAGRSDLIGEPIQTKGQPDMYSANQADIIKKLLRK